MPSSSSAERKEVIMLKSSDDKTFEVEEKEAEERKMILLKSSDGETFQIEEKAARLSKILENMIEENCSEAAIPLPMIKAVTMRKVIEFCNKHADSLPGERSLSDWDADFVDVEDTILFDYIQAANFLEISGLLDLALQKVGDMIRGKTPEEICLMFNPSTEDRSPSN